MPVPDSRSVYALVSRTRFGETVEDTHESTRPGVSISQFVRFIGLVRFSGPGAPNTGVVEPTGDSGVVETTIKSERLSLVSWGAPVTSLRRKLYSEVLGPALP